MKNANQKLIGSALVPTLLWVLLSTSLVGCATPTRVPADASEKLRIQRAQQALERADAHLDRRPGSASR